MNADEIRNLFKKHDVFLGAGDVWKVGDSHVIKHSALERLAAAMGIWFTAPTVLRSERDEAVILATGMLGDTGEWSIGEALVNVNYRVSGKQTAYVYAMAEKRAKDRVILKLARLYGAYSEDEADDFKQPQAPQEPIKAPPAPPERNVVPMQPPPVKRGPGRPPKQIMAPPTPLPPEPEELFEWQDRETGELRHVTEAELARLDKESEPWGKHGVEIERFEPKPPAPVAEHPARKPFVEQQEKAMAAVVAPPVTPEQKKANAALSVKLATAAQQDIPAFLKREAPKPSYRDPIEGGPAWPDAMRDPDNWLRRLDTELAKLADGDAMQELWDKHVEPIYGDLFPPDGEEAQNILRHHMRKVEP